MPFSIRNRSGSNSATLQKTIVPQNRSCHISFSLFFLLSPLIYFLSSLLSSSFALPSFVLFITFQSSSPSSRPIPQLLHQTQQTNNDFKYHLLPRLGISSFVPSFSSIFCPSFQLWDSFHFSKWCSRSRKYGTNQPCRTNVGNSYQPNQ